MITTFHSWRRLSERPPRDQCAKCFVVAPRFPLGRVTGHGPLPMFCPGLLGLPAHCFVGTAEELRCTSCGTVWPEGIMPNEVTWTCSQVT